MPGGSPLRRWNATYACWVDTTTDGTLRDWARTALTGRMLGLLLVLLVAAGACLRLGAWQLDRAALRGADRAESELAERLSAEPQPLEDVLRAQTSFTGAELGAVVTAVGAFEDQQVLVPDRTVDGEPATLVVTALRLAQGPDAGAMIPVLRGWVPPDAVDITADGVRPADAEAEALLAVPAGEHTVVGALADSESSVTGDLPDGVLGAISTGQLANLWGGPSFSGYLVLAEGHPAAGGLAAASPPGLGTETGLNVQNLAYAVEWWIFGGFALLLWWRTLRDEVNQRREDDALLRLARAEG